MTKAIEAFKRDMGDIQHNLDVLAKCGRPAGPVMAVDPGPDWHQKLVDQQKDRIRSFLNDMAELRDRVFFTLVMASDLTVRRVADLSDLDLAGENPANVEVGDIQFFAHPEMSDDEVVLMRGKKPVALIGV